MTLASATSFSLWVAAKSGRAACGGAWAAGSAASNGNGKQTRFAAVRVGASADALVTTPSWQVHARCTTLHRADALKRATQFHVMPHECCLEISPNRLFLDTNWRADLSDLVRDRWPLFERFSPSTPRRGPRSICMGAAFRWCFILFLDYSYNLRDLAAAVCTRHCCRCSLGRRFIGCHLCTSGINLGHVMHNLSFHRTRAKSRASR